MTAVHVHLTVPQPGTTARLPAKGIIVFSLYRRVVEGDAYVLVTRASQVLVNGEATLYLTPTSTDNAWVVEERVPDGRTRAVSVPASGSTIEYNTLPEVSLSSLTPVVDAVPAWTAAVTATTTARDQTYAARDAAQQYAAGSLQRSSNLSDLMSAATARTNLGLDTAATQPSTAFDAAGAASTAQAAAVQRANHTGTQPASTVTGLAPVATSGAYGDLTGKPALGTAAAKSVGDFDASGVAATAQAYAVQRANHTGTQSASTVTGLAAVATTGAKADVGLGNVDNTSDVSKPVSTATQTALSAKAPLASPALTGTPTTPTAATADSSTTIANTAFVKAQGYLTAYTPPDATSTVKGVVQLAGDLAGTAAAPTLTTSGVAAGNYGSASQIPVLTVDAKGRVTAASIAAAASGFANPMTTLGDLIVGGASGAAGRLGGTTDTVRRFLRTVGTGTAAQAAAWDTLAVTDVAGAAPLASPAFSGTPTAPTAAAGTSTTQVATTAFTAAATLAAQQALVGVNAQTASYTLIAADAGKLVTMSATAATTITVPTNATVPYPVGTVVSLANVNTGAVSVAGASGVTVGSPAGARLTTQYAQASLVKIATDTWLLAGQTVA